MPYAPKPYPEHPNLKPAIALIVDDPAPCINPLWYFRHQVDRQAEPVYSRIKSLWSDRIEWRKLSTIAQQFVAAQTVQFQTEATPDTVKILVTLPFDTDLLTFSIPMPWPLFTGPTVQVDGMPSTQILNTNELDTGRWIMRGSVVSLSLPLKANVAATVTIKAGCRV